MPPRSPPWKRKHSPDDRTAEYLATLRNHKPVRPGGSRPPPFTSRSQPTQDAVPHGESLAGDAESTSDNRRSSLASFSPRALPGRPLVQAPSSTVPSVRGRKVSPTAVIQASGSGERPYRESGSRWLERQEAHSLRAALETMDKEEEERRLHSAAQDEAAELVWRHRNPTAAEAEKGKAYRNPDMQVKNKYKTHLEKGAHARACSGLSSGMPRSGSSGWMSDGSKSGSGEPGRDHADDLSQPRGSRSIAAAKSPMTTASVRGADCRRSSGQRNVSSGSSKGVFRNPHDQIYEEPEDRQPSAGEQMVDQTDQTGALKSRNRNSLPQGSRPWPQTSNSLPWTVKQAVNQFEIHQNPPSQSRNAAYTTNPDAPWSVIREVDTPPSRDSLEIRSDEIRAATSMRKKDRSPKLPTPTAVSDRLGRPIVSFDPAWNPSPLKADTESIPERSRPSVPVPIINVSPDDNSIPTIPVIHFPDEDITPSITVSEPPVAPVVHETSPHARPLPTPSHASAPKQCNTKTPSRLPWLNPAARGGVPTVACANCALPIAGRVVTASGSSDSSPKARLHPECFTCHHCATALECVAFYPEPDNKRLERLAADGIDPESAEADLRFYCHLDFHEFFSPRCRSCKTPIEGEVIIAAGAEWHPGHFFCGECGDPFDSDKPFVEKDGYAFCVDCHTKRTSARCKACKRQILDDMTVEALGGKWHAECFACCECGGGFGDEGRFFVRDVEVEASEKERRRGMFKKMEERAVCEGCEGRRLKA